MKKRFFMALPSISLCLFATVIASCEPDGTPNVTASPSMSRISAYPDNPANPYDVAGQLYNTLTESYIYGSYLTLNATDAVTTAQTIADGNADFIAVKPAGYTGLSASRIDYITTHQQTAATDIISNSGLSAKGQASLSGFVNKLMSYPATTDYSVIYSYVMDYETSTLADPLLTAYDRRIILTTSSIAREGFYLKKKKRPRDRDWDISWGNITAGTEGSTQDMAKAITMSVATGILMNR